MYLFWWHLKSEWVCGWFNSAPSLWGMCSSWCIGGVRRREKKRQVCDRTKAAMIMAYLSPWRPRAVCAARVQNPRHSFLCSWTVVWSGVCSKIRLEEMQKCQGWVWHCSACSRNMLNGRRGYLQPVSPLGRLSSNMMYTLPSGCWSWRTWIVERIFLPWCFRCPSGFLSAIHWLITRSLLAQ